MSDLLSRVPKTLRENLAWRRALLEKCRGSRELRAEVWAACSRDILFFCNALGWVFEPREARRLPFLTWGFQDRAMVEIEGAVGKQDIGIEKSRDMGGSWMILYILLWRWLFRKDQAFLLVSRNEDCVDKPSDPDSLFWKLMFILEGLPGWMRPNIERTNLHLLNRDMRSVIDGASTTGNVGRSGRRLAVLNDEFAAFGTGDDYKALASTQSVTNCRIFLSTPQGGSGAFYDVMHKKDSGLKKIRLHWSDHPHKRPGLYTSERGLVRVLDGGYEFPAGYRFILDGKTRSPWYDNECRRSPIPQIIAQELDIDYLGSEYAFFDHAKVDGSIERDARTPFQVGDLSWDHQACEARGFSPGDRGGFSLWVNLVGERMVPPQDRPYVVACDVAEGTGASNSCLVVWDNRTKEKVAEYKDPNIDPGLFGSFAVAVCRWFAGEDGESGAFLIWEANGPGRSFGKAVVGAGHRNIYYRTEEQRLLKKESDFPGWFSTPDAKKGLLTEYRRALCEGLIVNRSVAALMECKEYIFTAGGAVVHARSQKSVDPSGARESHGDIVIADALATKSMTDRHRLTLTEVRIPRNCLMARRLALASSQREAVWW